MPAAIVTQRGRLRQSAVLAASLFGLLAVMPCQLVAAESPALRTAKEVFRPGEPIYVFIPAKRSNMLAWTVRSWRIVGSGGCGLCFGVSGLTPKPSRSRRRPPPENGGFPQLFQHVTFMDGH